MNSNPRRFHAFAAVLALLLLSPQAGAQPRERQARPAAPKGPPREIASKVLPNGLHVLVWPDHDISNVSLYTYYHVGSRNERPGITGLSHFFEHMMFNGSARFPPGEFDRVMEENGGSNNAYTSNDVTVYQNWFPRSALETIFQLEADRVCCLAIDSTVVESERGVVSSERRTRVDDDNASLLDEQVMATAYVAHPYQIPVIGWPSDIQHWSMSDLKSYFRTYYAPNNATMVVAGDVTPEEIFRLAEKHFGPIPAQPRPARVPAEPPQMGERRLVVRKTGQVPLLEAVFHVGTPRDPDFEASTSCTSFSRRGILEALPAAGRSGARGRGRDVLGHGGIRPRPLRDPGHARGGAAPRGRGADSLRGAGPAGSRGPVGGRAEEGEEHPALGVLGDPGADQREGERARRPPGVAGRLEVAVLAPGPLRGGEARDVQALARKVFDEKNRTVGILIPEEDRAAGTPGTGRSQ